MKLYYHLLYCGQVLRTAVGTGQVYYCIHSALYTGETVGCTGRTMYTALCSVLSAGTGWVQGCSQALHRAPPQAMQRDITNMRTRFHCKGGCIPGTRTPAPPPPRREANSWPTGLVRLCIGVKLKGLHRTPPSNWTGALTGHYIARRRTCKERIWTGEGMWCAIMLAFHIVSTKPGEAPTEGWWSHWLFT